MNEATGSGSYFAYLLFLAELALIPIVLVGDSVLRKRARERAATVASSMPKRSDPPPNLTLGDDVLIDVSSRYNEAVVSNIDAIDTALVAILALPVAFAVFAVDKIKDLSQHLPGFAIAFLLASGLTSFTGYLWGSLIRGGRSGIQDGIVPRRFLADYAQRGAFAVADVIRTVNAAGDQNARIRWVKRSFAAGALVYFLVGAGIVVVARLAGSHTGP